MRDKTTARCMQVIRGHFLPTSDQQNGFTNVALASALQLGGGGSQTISFSCSYIAASKVGIVGQVDPSFSSLTPPMWKSLLLPNVSDAATANQHDR